MGIIGFFVDTINAMVKTGKDNLGVVGYYSLEDIPDKIEDIGDNKRVVEVENGLLRQKPKKNCGILGLRNKVNIEKLLTDSSDEKNR